MVSFDHFARYYDFDHAGYRDDIDLYLNFARRCGSPALELACGTGRVLLPLAEAGFRVTGLDISPAMLEIAARKLAAAGVSNLVKLEEGDARDFHLPLRFNLIFLALNSFMHFLEQDDQLRVLRCAAEHLKPGGLLVVDLFNPDLLQLSQSHGALVHNYTRTDPATGHTVSKLHASQVDAADQRLDITFLYDEIDGDATIRRLITPFSLHYYWAREAVLLLEKAGFHLEHIYGSYDLDDYSTESERMILVAACRAQVIDNV